MLRAYLAGFIYLHQKEFPSNDTYPMNLVSYKIDGKDPFMLASKIIKQGLLSPHSFIFLNSCLQLSLDSFSIGSIASTFRLPSSFAPHNSKTDILIPRPA